jgi:hypothetical protein
VTALTATPWLAVLQRIVRSSDDETTRTLAKILYEIFNESSDPVISQIADHYAYQILGSMT